MSVVDICALAEKKSNPAREIPAGRIAGSIHPEGLKSFEHVKDIIGFTEYYREEERYSAGK